MENKQSNYLNPYVAGVLLGLTLLLSFLWLGAGLGASGGIARVGAFLEGCIAPAHTWSSQYFGQWKEQPMRYYLVFMLAGVFLGGLLSAFTMSRVAIKIERGAKTAAWLRLSLALFGGVLVGFASRLAQGCPSGQALTGGALLLTGSMIFMGCMFVGGYLAAWFVRGQWHD